MYKYKSLDDEVKWNEAQRLSVERKLSAARPFALNLSENNLNEKQFGLLCRAVLDRRSPLNIQSLDLSVNHNINDHCARVLFRCIGAKCPLLEAIDLSFANITDVSCDVIYDFYGRYFLDREAKGPSSGNVSLHKIDLSFTRISGNGLLTLDALCNTIHIDTQSARKHQKHKLRRGGKLTAARSERREAGGPDAVDSANGADGADGRRFGRGNGQWFGRRRHSKSQSFEIVLKGCFFGPMLCRNYDARSAVPRLQTTCCLKVESGGVADGQ